MSRSYEIKERPANLGGGWILTMFEDGEEMGRGVYPLPDHRHYIKPFDQDETKWRLESLFDQAQEDGESWVSLSTD